MGGTHTCTTGGARRAGLRMIVDSVKLVRREDVRDVSRYRCGVHTMTARIREDNRDTRVMMCILSPTCMNLLY